MIRIADLTKRYESILALDGITFGVERGELVALLGANGSGKSTLFKCLLGIHSYEGSVEVSGMDPILHGKQVRGLVGYMSQHCGLHLDLTLEETLSLYASLRRATRGYWLEILDRLGLIHKLNERVGELSGGMRQRLAFGLAVIARPRILLLDEPTASLDVRSQEMILEWLTELHRAGTTILISTHSRQEVMAVADRAITLESGKLIEDSGVLYAAAVESIAGISTKAGREARNV